MIRNFKIYEKDYYYKQEKEIPDDKENAWYIRHIKALIAKYDKEDKYAFDRYLEILSNREKVDDTDEYGWTILMDAASALYGDYNKNNEFFVYMLDSIIEADADWYLKNVWGDDFMHYLSEEGKERLSKKFPEKYAEYKMKGEIKKFNL